MAENLIIPPTADRRELYTALLPQIQALVAGESDPIANMANVAAVLRQAFGFFWVGFYRVVGQELVLGPFQGPLACSRIGFGKGVCGAAWKARRSIRVPDVDTFPGHIACSSESKSEIVIPVFDAKGQVTGILDIDSDKPDDFTPVDISCLEEWMQTIGGRLF
ncbi:GAF domain-containing protein [uncultured Rikenella sp.]|uniref:GAF domain-containing protein n=1 Tax=uncultured Rikenella sp. TaxID=368003 RepID=UPI002627ABD0|nr:GAF domain-containing protein [uncultured Rikenella sp.]